jgi:hypothetical protein
MALGSELSLGGLYPLPREGVARKGEVGCAVGPERGLNVPNMVCSGRSREELGVDLVPTGENGLTKHLKEGIIVRLELLLLNVTKLGFAVAPCGNNGRGREGHGRKSMG